MGRIDLNPPLCSGCLSCELVCSLKHYGYFDFEKSRIRVSHKEEKSEIDIFICIQCEDRSCIKACPTNALTFNEEIGCVDFNSELCSHCRLCEKKCMYGAVQWDYESGTPMICDLCGGDPECLKPCRLHQALTDCRKEGSV
jgi:anaerobic carbon-monoxide dehydrogenase iron sulfur subunit